MVSRPGMLRRMAIRRRIAAERDAARLAGAKMNPARARLHAFLAFMPDGMANGGY